jgi:hypothetical protein
MLTSNRAARVLVLVFLLLLALVGSTLLVLTAVKFGVDLGYVRTAQFELNATAVVAAIIGTTGLVSAVIAFDRTNLESKALKARFAFDINQAFFQSDSEREFFYKIEHEQFLFDPLKFPQSDDERSLDRILYRLSLVGKLLRDGVLSLDDVQFMKYVAKSVLTNRAVLDYLAWLKNEAPDHSSFVNAVYLYKRAYGRRNAQYIELTRYIG